MDEEDVGSSKCNRYMCKLRNIVIVISFNEVNIYYSMKI